jgi:CheY-like chemotaxis protein
MSHEMRTPLNGILGSLDLLARPNLSTKQQSYIDAMRLSGDLLLNRVNDVLDLSSFESGKIALVSRAFDLSEMLEELLQSLSGAALKFGNKLVLSSTPQVPQFVLGDKTRLRQIFSNLLGNAIKYSENSQITLEVAQLTGPDSEGRIEFKVIDQGIGISEQDIPHIFEDFYTVDNSLTRKSEGTGLGLGITKRLVNKMGGEIGVTSTLGSGSVFWIRLPLPNVTAPGALDSPVPSKTASVKGERPYEILLVEDNEINRFVTTEILNTLGHNVQTADDGLKGVSEANKRAYDLILMDISMPNMDGIAATAKIRGESVYNKATPIYALTAHANHQDRERFQKEGMNECILKPISKSIIADILAEIEVSTVHS